MQPKSYKEVWLIGDDFVSESVGEFFQSEDDVKPYMREKYEVKVFASTSLKINFSVMARLHNNFINAVKEETIFLKAIIFVLDGDLIKSVCSNK